MVRSNRNFSLHSTRGLGGVAIYESATVDQTEESELDSDRWSTVEDRGSRPTVAFDRWTIDETFFCGEC